MLQQINTIDPWGGVREGLNSLNETIMAIPKMKAAMMTLEDMYEEREIKSKVKEKYAKELIDYNKEIDSIANEDRSEQLEGLPKFEPGKSFQKKEDSEVGLEGISKISGDPGLMGVETKSDTEFKLGKLKKPSIYDTYEKTLLEYGRAEDVMKVKQLRMQQVAGFLKPVMDLLAQKQNKAAKYVFNASLPDLEELMPDGGWREVIDFETSTTAEGMELVKTTGLDKATGDKQEMFTIVNKATGEIKIVKPWTTIEPIEGTEKRIEAEETAKLKAEKAYPKDLTIPEKENILNTNRDDAWKESTAEVDTTKGFITPEGKINLVPTNAAEVKKLLQKYVTKYNKRLAELKKRNPGQFNNAEPMTVDEAMEEKKAEAKGEEGVTTYNYNSSTGKVEAQ